MNTKIKFEPATIEDFETLRVSVASPDEILDWSYGEITKPETVNYRTQKPERDGLFDERIFGPVKDYECYCGKYKKVRFKGIVCDRCGVEVTKSIVRRHRMGHVKLCVPVTHIWYLRGTPSRIGLMLGMSVKDVERVVYFVNYIVTKVDEEKKDSLKNELKTQLEEKRNEVMAEDLGDKEKAEKIEVLQKGYLEALSELDSIKHKQLITEYQYRDFEEKFGDFFEAKSGTDAIYALLKEIDLDELLKELVSEIQNSTGQRKKKAMTRMRLVKFFVSANKRPEWMIITVLPVIPPDLRPMVQLDGGRFATSDLNDLYRRVINRNNRLKRLLDINAPDVIMRNEKRMLQEAVDALIDNESKRGKAITTQAKRKLKSLSDILRGKQGRFRQNLLGKRVDYSGRSVIVVGPELQLHQCGLPKKMALELFKPFVVGRLVRDGLAANIKIAQKMVEKQVSEVWDILEEITNSKYVLLNRAPTLHRLGIQAFQPILVEGSAIRIHPLVCSAFNADFDGDQMAVHVPLSENAQKEAKEIMLSSHNLLKPADGVPVVTPSQDIIIGVYWMTKEKKGALGEGKFFADPKEAILAYQNRKISIRALIKVRMENGEVVETVVGRLLFARRMPKGFPFYNQIISKSDLKKIIAKCYKEYGEEETAKLVDEIKNFGFKYATRSGITFSAFDLETPNDREGVLGETDQKIENLRDQYKQGLITNSERRAKLIENWMETTESISQTLMKSFDPENPIFMMVDSGARGDSGQLNQLSGIVGLVVNPAGEIIELPIKSNYKEGLPVLEYFISTHAARKGKSDTALRTSDSGYLTRRLVDVSQDIVITEEDCKDKIGFEVFSQEEASEGYGERVVGRVLAKDVLDEKGKVLAKAGTLIDENLGKEIEEKTSSVTIRSALTCRAHWGVCQKCYGLNLAKGKLAEFGEAVGVVAAQSIGEPGTQLTMRTFHAGGVAGTDITQGLPRVNELFEVRPPKGQAYITEISGKVSIKHEGENNIVKILSDEPVLDKYKVVENAKVKVKSNAIVEGGEVLLDVEGKKVFAKHGGTAKIEKGFLVIERDEHKFREYVVPKYLNLIVKNNEQVFAGQQLTEGSINLDELLEASGLETVQRYFISEVKKIYAAQGQNIADKHLEIIIRQMFSKVRIVESGDSHFLPGEVVERRIFEESKESLIKDKKFAPRGEVLLMGITKISLLTDSFLSAASFQETTRVLTEAAVSSRVDELKGLKENVIIGRLIPAGTGYKKRLISDKEEHLISEGTGGPVVTGKENLSNEEMEVEE